MLRTWGSALHTRQALQREWRHYVPPARTAVTFSISCPLIFYLKENHLHLLCKLPRVGDNSWHSSGFCARAAGPKDFVPLTERGWVQEGRRGCRGTGKGAGSGIQNWQLGSSHLCPQNFVYMFLLQNTCPVATMELCSGFLLELRSFLE